MLIDPIATSVIYTNGAGLDLHTDPPNEFAIADAEYALIHNSIQEAQRNAPGGFAGLDNLSTVNATVRVQYIDAATADGLIPRSGELLVTSDTKELRYGDSFKQGGFRAGINSKSTIYIGGDDTALNNGIALYNAYNTARTANPNGAAKSATNRMTILLGPGVYDLNGTLVFDTPFVDIVGLDMVGCRVRLGAFTIWEPNTDWSWRNLTFYKSSTSHQITWRLNDTPINIYWENLRFEGIASDTIITTWSRTGAVTTSSISGTLRNVKTACGQLLNATNSVASHTINLNFEDCEAGNRFMAPSSTVNRFIYTGIMRNCNWTNTILCNFDMTSTARFIRSTFGMPLNYCVTGARIEYCRFVPAVGVASLKGVSATQNVFISHCSLSATGIDSTISNQAGATAALACNVLSDN